MDLGKNEKIQNSYIIRKRLNSVVVEVELFQPSELSNKRWNFCQFVVSNVQLSVENEEKKRETNFV
jgi:hypothetical protein